MDAGGAAGETSRMFARGCSARTADLHLRYRQPVKPAAPCRIEARLVSRRGGAFQLEATLHQAGLLCARALKSTAGGSTPGDRSHAVLQNPLAFADYVADTAWATLPPR